MEACGQALCSILSEYWHSNLLSSFTSLVNQANGAFTLSTDVYARGEKTTCVSGVLYTVSLFSEGSSDVD